MLTLAYIGPGAGLGAIIFTIAMALGVVLLVAGLVWYPLKRVVRSRRQATITDGAGDGSA